MVITQPDVNEFPEHPLPHVPPVSDPQHPHAQPATVFVYEKQRWEYKVVTRNTADDVPLSEDELNVLGKDGWELVGVAPIPSALQFYLKRTR